MANHISLTAEDGSMTIIDKNRIISCENFYPLNEDKYEDALREFKRQNGLWSDKRKEAFFNESETIGQWESENPSPKNPKPDDYRVSERFT